MNNLKELDEAPKNPGLPNSNNIENGLEAAKEFTNRYANNKESEQITDFQEVINKKSDTEKILYILYYNDKLNGYDIAKVLQSVSQSNQSNQSNQLPPLLTDSTDLTDQTDQLIKEYSSNILFNKLKSLLKKGSIIADKSEKPYNYSLSKDERLNIDIEIAEHDKKQKEYYERAEAKRLAQTRVERQHNFWKDYIASNYDGSSRLIINWSDIVNEDVDPEIAKDIFNDPHYNLSSIKESLKQYNEKADFSFTGFPKMIHKNVLKELRNKDSGIFFADIELDMKTDIISVSKSTKYECPSCNNIMEVINIDYLREKKTVPSVCGCGRKGGFRILSNDFIELQKLRIRDLDVCLKPGEQPVSKHAIISNALLHPDEERKLNIGDRITICAYRDSYFEKDSDSRAIEFLQILGVDFIDKINYDDNFSKEELNNFRDISNNDPLGELSYNIFIDHNGDRLAKELATLQLFSGYRNNNKKESLNILLFGDPGTGKTENFLLPINNIHHRSVFVSSDNNTSAGLGVSSVKDDFLGKHIADLGAVPRANKGILLVDELNDANLDVFGSMLQAMESGFVTVNKSGAHGNYPADIKVLATMNPKNDDNRLTKDIPLFDDRMGLTGKLKDRFDFVIPMINDKDIDSVLDDIIKGEKLSTCDINIITRYIVYSEKYNPIIAKDKLKEYLTPFLSLCKDDVVISKQSEHRILRKCQNLLRAIARLHLSDVVTDKHVRIATDIYSRYSRYISDPHDFVDSGQKVLE